jgi:hypothetical protein
MNFKSTGENNEKTGFPETARALFAPRWVRDRSFVISRAPRSVQLLGVVNLQDLLISISKSEVEEVVAFTDDLMLAACTIEMPRNESYSFFNF